MRLIADLLLETPSCGAVEQMKDHQQFRCLGPGGSFGAYGLMLERPDRGTTKEELRTLDHADCEHCPMGLLPDGVQPVSSKITAQGLHIQLLVADEAKLEQAFQNFRVSGQQPRRIAHREMDIAPSGRWVPLESFPARQREALEIAERIGYFQPSGGSVQQLGEEMGVSSSTAHEHLQKALARVTKALTDAPRS